jgi:hypothetical protein
MEDGKKRKSICLNESNYQWFMDWLKQNNLPRITCALMMDEYLLVIKKTILELEEKKISGESVSLADLFQIAGQSAQDLELDLKK